MMLQSMKRRIGFCIAAVLALVLIVLSVVAHREFQEAQMRNLDYRLQTDGEAVCQILATDGMYTEDAEKEIRAILGSRAGTRRLGFAIWEEGASQVWLREVDPLDVKTICQSHLKPFSTLPESRLLAVDENGLRARMIWRRCQVMDPATGTERPVNIATAISSEHPYHETAEFTRLLLLVGAGLLAGSVAAVYGIFRWGFRPVEVLTERMNRISGTNLLGTSFDCPPMPQELLPFVKAWQVMLIRLSEAMEEQRRFISDVSHELRTPLALMKSTLQLAQSQPRTQAYYQQTIAQSLEDLERLSRLVQQMLELSRLDSLPARLEREPMDLGCLLEEIVEQYAEYAQERGFTLVYRRASVWISAHPEQMRRLFCNLLDNAIQYGPAGTPITIQLKPEDVWIRVHVHDEGGQIPPEECSLLFHRFYRVYKARDRHSGGTGLGLAIAREIAVLHGGDISVRSSPQEGTTFTVRIPRLESARG